MAKLSLGTAQFGLDYGVSNTRGQISLAEAHAILELAKLRGIEILDTAPAYGTSEQVLGELKAAAQFKLISKTPQFRRDEILAEDAAQVRQSIETSLEKLGAEHLHGVLVHWPGDLLARGGDLLWGALSGARSEGLVHSIGVSVYDPAELLTLMDRYPIDVMQAPMNVLDQRMTVSGALATAKAKGVSNHIRSAFLQGLLLMDQSAVPPARQAAKHGGARRDHRRSGARRRRGDRLCRAFLQ
jgi:aryl-alcohol dehydrogenase-like predicted oxidoreductase